MRYFQRVSRRTWVILTILVVIPAYWLLRVKSAEKAEAVFREFFAALERRDRQTWIKYASPEELDSITHPLIKTDEALRNMYIHYLTPLRPEFRSYVGWDCSTVEMVVHDGRLGPWVVVMKRGSGWNWQVWGRKYIVNDDYN